MRSSSIVGGASLVNLVLGLVRTIGGAANVQLGAKGAEHGDLGEGLVRRALFWATLILAFAGTLTTWAARKPIARLTLGDESYAGAVGWLAIGVGLTVALNSQNAVLTGLRRMGDVGRVTLLSGVFATLASLASLVWLGTAAILVFVLAFPLANVLVAAFYTSRLRKPASIAPPFSGLGPAWRELVSLGFAIHESTNQLNGNALSSAAAEVRNQE